MSERAYGQAVRPRHPHKKVRTDIMQAYSDPAREHDPHALPDVEVFYRTAAALVADGWVDGDGDPMGEGWYYWFCFPGCMPDTSDPFGPFDTEAEALADAREGNE